MVYKRTNRTLNSNVQFIAANNAGIYINSGIMGANFAPYHGIYIHEREKKTEVYLSKMIETIQIGHNKYNIMDVKTSENTYGGCEYLESFTDEVVPTFVYNVEGVVMEKKYKLHPTEKILCIEYRITNNTGSNVKFYAKPCVTKRDIIDAKRESEMKFTPQINSSGVKVTLSISENVNLYIKSNMKTDKVESYLKGVNYDFEYEVGNTKTYVEDLYIPVSFESSIKNGNTNTFSVFVALEDVDLRTLRSNDIEIDINSQEEMRHGNIDKNFYELKELARSAYKLHYIDKQRKQLVLTEAIPTVRSNDEYVKNMIMSIEGNYLLLKRYKEAHKILESMMLKLKDKTYTLTDKDRCEAMLLFIEALNRYLMETEATGNTIRPFYQYIKTNIYEYLDKSQSEVFADKDFLLTVSGKKYIKLNALWYNALRIFVDLADKFNEESEFIYTISETLRENIVNTFWDEENKVLKYESEEDAYATIDMVYALSLSYPVLKDTDISMKLMDTLFKQLYTAYGMRLGAANTKQYDGCVYPHLMVHFLKANLRQMGVTRASQKLAYNLVKEMFAEIGKSTVGTVGYKYNERTKKTYGPAISAITNAEIIRAFDMLT